MPEISIPRSMPHWQQVFLATVAMLLSSADPGRVVLAAATEDETVDDVIDEIQVTATRRSAATDEVSAALTIIGEDDIRNSKVVTDSLAAQPGIFLQQTTPGQGAAIVRGLKGSEVLHLVDGFRLNNAIFRNAPTQYLALVAPGSVQQIEVLRGAPASLYGSDAVGGVLQVISRMPEFDESGTRGELHLAYDSADLGKVLRGSVETGDERLSASISAEHLDTGNRRTGGGNRVGPSGYDASGARIALLARPAVDQSWSLDLQFARQPDTPRYDELVPGFDQTEPSSSEFLFAPNERTFVHLRHTRENWLWSADWNFSAGWQQIVDDRVTRDYQSPDRRFEKNSSDLYGVTGSFVKDVGNVSWIAGVEFYHDRVRSQRREEDIFDGQSQELAPRFPDRSAVDQAAIYGNVQLQVTERHQLVAGLRYSAIDVDIPGNDTVPSSSIRQRDPSVDFGWLFDLSDATQLVANFGYGFRAPNVFDLGTLGERPGNRFNVPNPDLESEHVTQVDFGVRHNTEHWDLDIVLFGLHYTDRISSELTGAVTPAGRDVVQSQNVATADIYGIEAGMHIFMSALWSAQVIVNLQRGEQRDASGATVPADRMPPFNGRVALYYSASESLRIEPYIVFAGRQDRLSPRDVRDVRISPAGTPGWLSANIAATWRASEDWRFRLAVLNLFDKRYRVHGSGIDAVGRNIVISADRVW